MKIRKFGHSAFVLSEGDRLFVVDPGTFTAELPALTGVDAIFISHAHPDHLDPAKVRTLVAANPPARIVGAAGVDRLLDGLPIESASEGDLITVGPFALEFVGGEHAEILPEIPRIANLGVIVNEGFYYPGDSLVPPGREVDTVVLPVSAPWLKISDVEDFVLAVRPRRVVPAHTGVLSADGLKLTHGLVAQIAERAGSEVLDLQPGDEADLA
jgi:L-ascorbate metabolism protein UlaG (beta-lactamase superfamily)